MSDLTESEIISCHLQALHDAKGACELLGKNAMEGYLAPRGHHYGVLKEALELLEGSARQMSHYRSDARWLKLGILYARLMQLAQAKFVGQKWKAFHEMRPFFDNALRNMDELCNKKTGRIGSILPTQGTDWLIMPNYRPPRGPPVRVH